MARPDLWHTYPDVPGAFWPCASGGYYGFAWVECIDDPDDPEAPIFESDDDAARAVAAATGWPLRWAPLQPFPGAGIYSAPYVQPPAHDRGR